MTIKIKRFKIDKMDLHSMIYIVAKRNSGKTVLVRDILYHIGKKYPVAMVISPTEKMNRNFGDHIPPVFLHEEYSDALLGKLLTRQKSIVTQYNENNSINPNCVLVLDDCLGSAAEMRKDVNYQTIFVNGRHYKLNVIMTSQYVLALTPLQRGNIDYVFLLLDNNKSNIKRYYEQFGGMFDTFEEFKKVYQKLTENYGVMVIDNKVRSSKIEDCVFYYKVNLNQPNFNDFKICDQKFWDIDINAIIRRNKELVRQKANSDPNTIVIE